MASVKTNIIINGINTVASIILPVITFPYAARVLLPEGVGAINFLNSIIGYIVLLTSLGIPLYAVKEVAKFQNDKEKRDKITIEIILLSTILCVIGYIGVFILAKFIPQIHRQASLFYVLSLTIVFNAIGVNWFYKGVEDFKFITIRSLIFRVIAAVCLFLFVKSSSDLIIYAWIIIGSTVGSNIINFIHLRKFIAIKRIVFSDLNLIRHIKPTLQVFILNLIISLYIQLNSIMLGFISGEESVGIFSAGTKISHIGLTIIGSLGTVLLPRVSNLIEKGDGNGFKAIIVKSLDLTLALSLPIAAGLMVLSKPITIIFCGSEYLDSISVLLLNAPVVIFVSLTNLMGLQILYPKDKIGIVIWSVTGGAVANVILNIFLIPSYGASGAAFSTLIAEFSVLMIQIILGRDYYPFSIRQLFNNNYIVSTIIMAVSVMCSNSFIHNDIYDLGVGFSIGVCSYLLSLIILKDKLTIDILKSIKYKFK